MNSHSRSRLIQKTYTTLKHISLTICATFLLLATGGCEQKDLCFDHSHLVDLDIDFDWHLDPEASPESMVVYFFPKDGGKPTHYEFAGHDGGSIRISAGQYDVVCFNSDTHNITLIESDSEYSFTITAKDDDQNSPLRNILSPRSSSLPLHEGTEDERIAMQSEDMWEGVFSGLTINMPTEEEETYHLHRHLTLMPDKVTDTYHIIIKGINNIENLRELNGSISGMAGGLNVASHHANEEEVIIPFELNFYRNNCNAQGTVVSFGSSINPIHGHYLMVYATMSDGNTYYYEFDVSDQIDHPTGEGHEHYIVIDMLDLGAGEPMAQGDEIEISEEPEEPQDEGGAGFHTSVDDWGDPTNLDFQM